MTVVRAVTCAFIWGGGGGVNIRTSCSAPSTEISHRGRDVFTRNLVISLFYAHECVSLFDLNTNLI